MQDSSCADDNEQDDENHKHQHALEPDVDRPMLLPIQQAQQQNHNSAGWSPMLERIRLLRHPARGRGSPGLRCTRSRYLRKGKRRLPNRGEHNAPRAFTRSGLIRHAIEHMYLKPALNTKHGSQQAHPLGLV